MGFGHRLSVDTADVDTTGGRLRTGARSIRTELDSLIANVTGLTSTSWRGRASESFGAHYAELNQGWQQVEAALEGIANSLKGTSAAYADTEDVVSRQYRA